MTFFPLKIALLGLVIASGVLLSGIADAAILRSSDGMPVLTKNGDCVTTGWQGSEDCAAAKAAAGLGGSTEERAATEGIARDKTVYFGFNKSTLTPGAMNHLDRIAKKIAGDSKHPHNVKSMTIIGYADRLGNAEYNKKLALKRAESVRDYLVSKGVKVKIVVRSLGKAEPRAECSADLPHAKLIHCLRKDRRVEIEFSK